MTTAYMTPAFDADTLAVALVANEASRAHPDLQGHNAIRFTSPGEINIDRNGLQSAVTATLYRAGASDPATLSVTPGADLPARLDETFMASKKATYTQGQSFRTRP